jgi:hypothetical protein
VRGSTEVDSPANENLVDPRALVLFVVGLVVEMYGHSEALRQRICAVWGGSKFALWRRAGWSLRILPIIRCRMA